jgi:hypothetical protein
LGYLLSCSRHCGSHANAATTLGGPNVRVRVVGLCSAAGDPGP